MRFSVFAVAGLTGMMVAGAARAQVPTEQQKKAIVILQQKMLAVEQGSVCPGALQARQQAGGGAVIWTTALEDQKDKDIAKGKPTGLGVHVEFAGAKTPIRELELRVSYEPLGLKRMPVAPGANGFAGNTTEREKNFNLDREAAMRIGGDLLVGPAATITRVYLMSATFADGTVWRAPSADACSVVPSRFMPVQMK